MIENTAEETLLIYEDLYKYRDLLKDGPMLSVDVESKFDEEGDALEEAYPTVQSELKSMMGYLFGLPEQELTVPNMLNSVQKNYPNDDYWRQILIRYIELQQTLDEEEIERKSDEMLIQGQKIMNDIQEYKSKKTAIIQSFSKAIDVKGYPINSRRLVVNYLKMSKYDDKKAWETITTNPAFFAPLEVVDENGKRLMSVSDAKKLNKEIGGYIKKLKA